MSARANDAADRAWHTMVSLVMDSRGDWRRKVAEASGLPFSRVRALRRLGAGPMSLRDLAESMTTDAPAATVAVNDLETRGLVERRPHPTDGRTKLVSLTSAGRRVLASVRAVTDHAPQGLSDLPARDLATLQRVLDALAGDAGPRVRLRAADPD
ncbi:MAG TPA: MarR family transcriptional regulator [Polyangiaceae bacterium]|jgi:DNA-binding MarR family transcriptional regulator|nr:MarR family transcriptional regulator [Polyangiaceae bacterium]